MKLLREFQMAAMLALLVLFTCAKAEASDLGLYAIGGGLSVNDIELAGSAFGLDLRADCGEVVSNLRLIPQLSYWRKGVSSAAYFGSTSYTFDEIGLGADVHYVFNWENPISFYGGGGLGFYRVHWGDSFYGISETSIGLSLVGGLEANVASSTKFFAEFRLKTSTFDVVSLKAGLMFGMGN